MGTSRGSFRLVICCLVNMYTLAALAGASNTFKESFGDQFLTKFTEAITANFQPQATGVCHIVGGAPNLDPWKAVEADLDGLYVLLHYRNPAPPAGLPKSVLFVWDRTGMYAPWIVYFGSEDIRSAKVNPYGGVSFIRTLDATPTLLKQEQLVHCAQDPLSLTSQYTAYPCAQNPTQMVVVDTVLYNQSPPLFGGPSTAPDGSFDGEDWSNDRLIFSRAKRSTFTTALNTWDSLTNTTVTIDSEFHSLSLPRRFWISSASADGTIGYVGHNMAGIFSGTSNVTYKGAHPVSPGLFGQYVINTYYSAGTSFAALLAHTFISWTPFEYQGIYVPNGLPATGQMHVMSSSDGYSQPHALIQTPQAQAGVLYPTKIYSPVLGDALALQSAVGNAGSEIEIFQYIPSASGPGTFSHTQTLAAQAPNTHLRLLSGTSIPPLGGFLAVEHAGIIADGTIVLIDCF